MELQQHFKKTMAEAVNMALATSVGEQPNVRVVTFAYDSARPGYVFFTTFRGNQKLIEFEKNPRVACILLPAGKEAETQVRIFGNVKKAHISLQEMIVMVAKKHTGDADTLIDAGDMLEIYEVCIEQAYVTIGMSPAQLVNIQ